MNGVKIGYLQEQNGTQSSMRAMSVFAVAVAAGFGVWACMTESHIALYLSLSWMGMAFGAKVGQRAVENSTPKIAKSRRSDDDA